MLKRWAGFVKRTYISSLHDASRVRIVVFDPAQGQSLGSTHVRAMLVDAACSLAIKKGARAGGMGGLVQHRPMVSDDGGRLDLEHRQIVHAATGASAFAVEAGPIGLLNRSNELVHYLVKFFDPIEQCPRAAAKGDL